MVRLAALTVLAWLAGTPAFAHAFLERASPAVGSEVTGAPKALDLTFTEPVEPLFCHIDVTDAAGQPMTGGAPEARDNGRTLAVPLKPLPPGTYHVEWHVVSIDTHKTEGQFMFTVKP